MVTVAQLIERLQAADVGRDAEAYMEGHCCGANTRLFIKPADGDSVDVLWLSLMGDEELAPCP